MNRNNTKKRARVLIVDDHPAVREALAIADRSATRPGSLRRSRRHERGPAPGRRHPARRGRYRYLPQDRQRHRPDQADQGPQRQRPHAGLVDAQRIALRRACAPGRALGYINKDQATDKIVEAIRRVLEGKVYLSEAMAETMLHRTVGGDREEAHAFAARRAGRSRTGGLSSHRPGREDRGDRRTTAPERQDRRDLPRPHPPETGPERRHGTGPLRHAVDAGERVRLAHKLVGCICNQIADGNRFGDPSGWNEFLSRTQKGAAHNVAVKAKDVVHHFGEKIEDASR